MNLGELDNKILMGVVFAFGYKTDSTSVFEDSLLLLTKCKLPIHPTNADIARTSCTIYMKLCGEAHNIDNPEYEFEARVAHIIDKVYPEIDKLDKEVRENTAEVIETLASANLH